MGTERLACVYISTWKVSLTPTVHFPSTAPNFAPALYNPIQHPHLSTMCTSSSDYIEEWETIIVC